MKRLAIALLAIGALTLGACSWRSDVAASVDGTDVSSQSLETDARDLLAQPDFANLYLNGSGAAASSVDVRLPTSALAVLLSRRISDVLVQRELEARDLTVSDADLQEAEADLEEQLAQQEAQNQSGGQQSNLTEAFGKLPPALRNRLLRAEASATALRDALAAADLASFPADPRAWFDANPDQLAQYCLVSIPVSDEEQGKALVRQRQGGTTLTELVTRQQGQDEGCVAGYQLSQLPQDLADALRSAQPGDVAGPFQGQSSLLLVGLTSRTVPPYEQVSDEVATLYRQARARAEDPAWSAWMAGQKPDVSVDPRYGTWNATQLQVEPPVPPRSS